MSGTLRTSAVRVLGKSMHTLSGGWLVSVAWLWVEEIRQHVSRHSVAPPGYAVTTLVSGLVPAALMALIGVAIARWSGVAPDPTIDRREWWHAFWWSFVPNVLLFITVWVMLQEAR